MNSFFQKKYWIYLFPGLIDFSISSMMFSAAIKAIRLGVNPLKIGLLGSIWGGSYLVVNLYLRSFSERSRTYLFMVAGCLLLILLAAGFAFSNSLFLLFLLLSLLALPSALFFVGFQLSMSGVTGLPVYISTGFYTLAWSLGIGLGFLAQGLIEGLGPVISLVPAVAGALLVLVGIGVIKNSPYLKEHPEGVGKDKRDVVKNKVTPQREEGFLLVGWINILTASALSAGIRFLIPKLAISYFNLSPATSGLLLFLSLTFQGFLGLYLIKFKHWLYQPGYHFRLELIGLLGCLVAAAIPDVRGLAIMAGSIGIYNGHAFYNGVFYSLSPREDSGRNICINEALVGASALVGPLISGVALQVGIRNFFFVPLFLIIPVISAQLFLLFGRPKR